MSSLTVTPISTALGALISGVDITQPLSFEERDGIEQALLSHSVLFFRGQTVTRSNRRGLRQILATCTFTRSTPTCRSSPKC